MPLPLLSGRDPGMIDRINRSETRPPKNDPRPPFLLQENKIFQTGGRTSASAPSTIVRLSLQIV